MKSKYPWLCVALVAMSAHWASAEDHSQDPLHALLFPPELLFQHRAELGLSDQQIEQIRVRLEQVGPKAQEQQTRLNKATRQLAELLSAETIHEESALKQVDDVLTIENELKQLHLRLMIQIRNVLTAKQRQIAASFQQSPQDAQVRQQRLQAKVSRIERAVQSRAEAGQPPFEVVELMQKFPEFMQNGQVNEAEALLDRVIAMLNLGNDQPQPNRDQQPPQQQPRPTAPGGADNSQTEAARLSPAQLVAQVEALKEEDVAWRKIPWKTCLLDGLKASREQDKPVVLWIFIDRPIDDERC